MDYSQSALVATRYHARAGDKARYTDRQSTPPEFWILISLIPTDWNSESTFSFANDDLTLKAFFVWDSMWEMTKNTYLSDARETYPPTSLPSFLAHPADQISSIDNQLPRSAQHSTMHSPGQAWRIPPTWSPEDSAYPGISTQLSGRNHNGYPLSPGVMIWLKSRELVPHTGPLNSWHLIEILNIHMFLQMMTKSTVLIWDSPPIFDLGPGEDDFKFLSDARDAYHHFHH